MSRKPLYVGIDVSTAHENRKVFDFAAIGIDAEGETVLRIATVVDPGPTWWDIVARRKHGVSREDAAGKPHFHFVWMDFLDRVKRAAHSFDCRFLAEDGEYVRNAIWCDLGAGALRIEIECILDLAERLLPGLSAPTLDPVADALGLAIPDRHRAIADATAIAELARLLDLRGPAAVKPASVYLTPSASPPAGGWLGPIATPVAEPGPGPSRRQHRETHRRS